MPKNSSITANMEATLVGNSLEVAEREREEMGDEGKRFFKKGERVGCGEEGA